MAISFPPSMPMMPLAPPPPTNNDKPSDQALQQDDKPHGHHHKGGGQKMPPQKSHLQKQLVSNMRNEPRTDKMNEKLEKAAIKTDADASGVAAAAGEAQLHTAIKQQDMGLFQSLLSNGANPNALDQDGKTPLELAVHIFENMCRLRKSNDVVALARSFVVMLLEVGGRGSSAIMGRAVWAQRWRA